MDLSVRSPHCGPPDQNSQDGNMKLKIAVAALAAFTLSGCSGLKDALNAHTDWVARAGNAELAVTKLATLLGKSRAPIRKDIAKSMANVWIDYQLLGNAAAHNDSLNDSKAIDDVMWPAKIGRASCRERVGSWGAAGVVMTRIRGGTR